MTAETMRQQGIDLFMQHDYEEANRVFQKAKDAYEQDGNYDMVAEMKVNIGLVHRSLGESQQALELMQEALKHFKEQDDKMRMAQVLGNLGGVYLTLNDKEQAHLSYRQAADIFKEVGEDEMWSDTLMALGRLQFGEGKLVQGATTYGIALEKRPNLTTTQKIIKYLADLVIRIGGGSK